MTTSLHISPIRSLLILASCACTLFIDSASLVWGADQPVAQIPVVTFEVKKNDPKPQPNVTGKSPNGMGATNTTVVQENMRKADVTYTITIHNNAKFSAKNLAVEYHFYNKTVMTTNGIATSTLDDITSVENVDIDSGKNAIITTRGIPYQDSQASNGSATGRGGKGARTSPSITQTYVLGWHVEIRFNGKIIAHDDYPDNLQDLLKSYTQSK